MNPLKTRALTRDVISGFIKTERGIRAFEAVQEDVTKQYDALTTATFVTLQSEPTLGAERILTPVAGEIVGTDGGENQPYTLGLADTAVVAGSYGSALKTLEIEVDAKGRLLEVIAHDLNTSNIAEGSNLYFTDARARQSITQGAGISYNNTTGTVSVQSAGTYGAPTGTLSRTTFATYTAPTISSPPTQAEVQALANAVQTLSRTLAALITDLRTNGNLS